MDRDIMRPCAVSCRAKLATRSHSQSRNLLQPQLPSAPSQTTLLWFTGTLSLWFWSLFFLFCFSGYAHWCLCKVCKHLRKAIDGMSLIMGRAYFTCHLVSWCYLFCTTIKCSIMLYYSLIRLGNTALFLSPSLPSEWNNRGAPKSCSF